jgi:hypothetical protein
MSSETATKDPEVIFRNFTDALCDLLDCDQTPEAACEIFTDAVVELGNQCAALECDTDHVRHVLQRSLIAVRHMLADGQDGEESKES